MNSASTNISGPWLEQLTGAFEILLGRPLASFDADAVYATFFGGNLINELGFARDAAWVNPAALRGAEPVVWDGTLFDAMRVATALGTGPESLLPLEAEAAEEWQEALADLTPPELSAHLSFFCTEGEEGLMYLRTERSGGDLLADEGCTLIANWEEGQGQVEFAVVQVGELLAKPRPS